MFSKFKSFLAVSIVSLFSLIPSSVWAAIDTTAIQAEADAFKADALAMAGIIGVTFMAAAFAFVIYKWIRGAIFS